MVIEGPECAIPWCILAPRLKATVVMPLRVVDWSNNDAAIHIIVSDDGGFRSPPLESHDVFRHKFTTPGTFHFFCSVHPRMRNGPRKLDSAVSEILM